MIEAVRQLPGIMFRIKGELIVEDKDGKVIERKEFTPHSFVDNFSQWVWSLLGGGFVDCSGTPQFQFKDTDGNSQAIAFQKIQNAGSLCAVAPSGEDKYGILVGTSSQAWDYNDYNLIAKIAHGTGSGQLSYGATTLSTIGGTGAPATIDIQRSFDNLSGADITVNEIGLAVHVRDDTVPVDYYMLIARDVITATTVPNGGRLTVKYTIQINP